MAGLFTLRVSKFESLNSLSFKHVMRVGHVLRTGNNHRPPLAENHEITNVAVLGGGITGLVTAYCLARQRPTCKITLFEGSSRLGGWLNSRTVDVAGKNVVFEQGPRTLRPNAPNGHVTLALLHELNLTSRILATGKDSAAARNRYVYYPDHLVRMPGPGASLWENLQTLSREPLLNGIVGAAFCEMWRSRRPMELQDESIGSFVSRRFGHQLADNVVSALIHGIYAGDIYKLSIRSVFPSLWHMEGASGSVLRHMVRQWAAGISHDADRTPAKNPLLGNVDHVSLEEAKRSAVYSLKGGLSALSDALQRSLVKSGVIIRLNEDITNISLNQDSQVLLQTKMGKRETFSHAIATIPSAKLATCVEQANVARSLGRTPSVTVMVVNLFYRNAQLLRYQGFGYLLPRSIPAEMNPERALGVIFDSDATVGQDDAVGTKLTVMLGGHWWDGRDKYPDQEQGIAMARALLARHLSVTEEPLAARASLQKDCIPQYTVGHEDRMATLGKQLQQEYGGRLLVAGNSYTGVGLNDCVRHARNLVVDLTLGREKTGLDSIVQGRQWP